MNLKIKFKSSIFYALLLSFLLILLQGFTVAVVFTLTNKEHLSYAFGYLLALIIIIFKFRVTLIKDAKSFKEDIKGNVKNLVLFYIIFLLLMYCSNIILNMIVGNLATNESSIRSTFFEAPFLMTLTFGIIGPILEELIFRYPYRDIKTNKYLKFFISTFIFAFMHIIMDLSFPAVLYLIPYFFISLCVSYPFFKTGNIYTSMIAHITNNLSSFIILLIFGG
ncbi:MAG: CPBP family intramembrane metalloprotease [Bacilli bacterium]|nr:CPBP family intramembrane metalloprotease [Bacilli bacterium]